VLLLIATALLGQAAQSVAPATLYVLPVQPVQVRFSLVQDVPGVGTKPALHWHAWPSVVVSLFNMLLQLTGAGLGLGEGDGDGLGLGDGEGDGLGEGLGLGLGIGDGLGLQGSRGGMTGYDGFGHF
jgi:hypothetical protein